MILPEKHLSVEESIFGFGAFLLSKINKKTTIDSLWQSYSEDYKNNVYDVKFSFDQYIVVIDYLYSIGAVDLNKKGGLFLCV